MQWRKTENWEKFEAETENLKLSGLKTEENRTDVRTENQTEKKTLLIKFKVYLEIQNLQSLTVSWLKS